MKYGKIAAKNKNNNYSVRNINFPLILTEKYNLYLNKNKSKTKKNLPKTHKLTSLSALFQK